MRSPITAVALATLIIAASATATCSIAEAPDNPEAQAAWNKWVYSYKLVTELSRAGINVTDYVQALNQSLQAIEAGDYEEAEKILNEVIPRIEDDYAALSTHILMQNLRKYSTAAAILATPPLFYYLFPRAYLEIWYRLKKRWLVKRI